MSHLSRRELFRDVGRGMFAAALGPVVASDLGLGFTLDEEPKHLTFGDLDPLVSLLAETPPDKLLPKVKDKLKAGTDLKQVIAAAALVNARAFGGEDYDGYHTLMALAPAYWMSQQETREDRKPLAIMKVLMRNSRCLQARGGAKAEVLKPVKPGTLDKDKPRGEQIRDIVRGGKMANAEATFAAVCAEGQPVDALDALMFAVDDGIDVHRIVLVSRSWDLVNFVGAERAHTLLRQSVHFCMQQGRNQQAMNLLPKVLDQYGLLGKKAGTKKADDAWVASFAETVFRGTRSRPLTQPLRRLPKELRRSRLAKPSASLPTSLLPATKGGRRRRAGTSRPAAFTATPLASTPATPAMPGGTWPRQEIGGHKSAAWCWRRSKWHATASIAAANSSSGSHTPAPNTWNR